MTTTIFCSNCNKRLLARDIAANLTECQKCIAANEVRAEAEAREAARQAEKAERATARRSDPELLNFAVETALAVQSAQTNLTACYRSIAKSAAEFAEQTEAGIGTWGLGSNTTDAARYELELRLQAQTLRKLLSLMGRKDEFAAIVASPWTFLG